MILALALLLLPLNLYASDLDQSPFGAEFTEDQVTQLKGRYGEDLHFQMWVNTTLTDRKLGTRYSWEWLQTYYRSIALRCFPSFKEAWGEAEVDLYHLNGRDPNYRPLQNTTFLMFEAEVVEGKTREDVPLPKFIAKPIPIQEIEDKLANVYRPPVDESIEELSSDIIEVRLINGEVHRSVGWLDPPLVNDMRLGPTKDNLSDGERQNCIQLRRWLLPMEYLTHENMNSIRSELQKNQKNPDSLDYYTDAKFSTAHLAIFHDTKFSLGCVESISLVPFQGAKRIELDYHPDAKVGFKKCSGMRHPN